MPPGKMLGKVKNTKLGGDFFDGTECDNSAYNSSYFFCSLRSQISLLVGLAPYFQGRI